MLIATVDPGQSTGIILFDSHSQSILNFYTVAPNDAAEIVYAWTPRIIVLEKEPKYSDWGSDIRGPYQKILRYHCPGSNIELIVPGIWKPIAEARDWKYPNWKTTVHVKDAYNILRYWMFKTYRYDIGEPTWDGNSKLQF